MSAETLIKTGDLAGALCALQGQVRADPADARLRVFLFQLLCITGDWARAIQQLKTCATLSTSALEMAQMYRAAIICEHHREKAMSGEMQPFFDEDAPSWLPVLWDALKKQAAGDVEGADRLRAMILRAAPAVPGNADGCRFDWIADADSRFGPALEVIIDGVYRWLPFAALHKLHIEPPRDLRDLVWTPVRLTLRGGTEKVALIPTRYPATQTHGTPAQKLARATGWSDQAGRGAVGMGQRMFCTEAEDIPLLELRVITFDHPEPSLQLPAHEARNG
jgi:type VI secretion system protein ImpE